MPETAACIRWHAEATDKLYGQVAPSPEGTVATITREPVGVVGAVIPWNYPAQMAAWKLGPGARDRQHGRHQARLDDLAQPAADRGAGRRGRASPTASLNVVTGPGRHRRRGARPPPRRRLRRVHGLDRGRPPVPPLRRRHEPQAGAARARRQEPAARVRRRRRPRDGRRQRRDRDLLEHGRELLAPGSRLIVHRSRKDRAARGRRARSSRPGRSATRSTRRPGSAR